MIFILTEMTVADEKVCDEVRLITRQVDCLETALYYILDRIEGYIPFGERMGIQVGKVREKIKVWKDELYRDRMTVKDILNERREMLGLVEYEDTPLFDEADSLAIGSQIILSEFEAEAWFGEDFFVSVKELGYVDPL